MHSAVWGEVLQCHFLNKIYGRRPKEYYLKYTGAKGLPNKRAPLDRHGVVFDMDFRSQKQIGKPRTCLHMICDLRDDESAFSFGQSCEGNDLIGGKPIDRGAGAEIGQQVFRHIAGC